MTVNILIISHDNVGEALLEAAVNTLGFCPLTADVLPIRSDCDPEEAIKTALNKIQQLDEGDGILILTDIYGSTPSNISCKLVQKCNARVVSGINLPMLIRVLNYPKLNLDELTEKAVSGGREGIMDCKSIDWSNCD